MQLATLLIVLFATLAIGATFAKRTQSSEIENSSEDGIVYDFFDGIKGRAPRSTQYFKLCGNNLIQKIILTCKGCLTARDESNVDPKESSITYRCCKDSHCSEAYLKSLCCNDPLFE